MYSDRDAQREIDRAAKAAALSGAIGGGIFGASGAILGGVRKPTDLLKHALMGSIMTGAAAGGATKLGSELMGAPEPDDIGGYTERGTVGGLLGGGLLGGIGGAIIGSGKLKMPKGKWASKLSGGMSDNIFGDAMKKFASQGGKVGAAKGAGLGGGMGALGSAFVGSDEGMQLDFIMNKIQEEERQRMLRRMGA